MTLRIPSGDINQGVSFNLVPGLDTGNFTVWRSRNGATTVAMTTPTISEDGNLPGQYHITFDEDMDIAAGNVTEHMLYTILHSDLPTAMKEFEVELFVPEPIRRNVAFANFPFVMKSSSDHVTPLSGLTVTAERSINGASFAACANSPGEVGSGSYSINLANTDLNGISIQFKFTASGADPTIITIIPSVA